MHSLPEVISSQPRRVSFHIDDQSLLCQQRRVFATDDGYIRSHQWQQCGGLTYRSRTKTNLDDPVTEMDAIAIGLARSTVALPINRAKPTPSRFSWTANQKVRVRVLAQRLGSPLDSVLTIKDATGKELVTADDTATKDWQPPIVRDNNSPQICDDAEIEVHGGKGWLLHHRIDRSFSPRWKFSTPIGWR